MRPQDVAAQQLLVRCLGVFQSPFRPCVLSVPKAGSVLPFGWVRSQSRWQISRSGAALIAVQVTMDGLPLAPVTVAGTLPTCVSEFWKGNPFGRNQQSADNSTCEQRDDSERILQTAWAPSREREPCAVWQQTRHSHRHGRPAHSGEIRWKSDQQPLRSTRNSTAQSGHVGCLASDPSRRHRIGVVRITSC